MKYIKTTLKDFLNESNNNDTDLTLFHGSSNSQKFAIFNDNQFFTDSKYLAASYAYNYSGLLYEVNVSSLNPLSLIEEPKRMKNLQGKMNNGGPYMSGSDYYIQDIILNLYGNNASEYMKKYGIQGKLAYITNGDFEPLINFAKEQGFDSIKFYDESFDRLMTGLTYIIFNGNKPKISNVYEVDYKDEYEMEFKKI